jgi:hypothetical protein
MNMTARAARISAASLLMTRVPALPIRRTTMPEHCRMSPVSRTLVPIAAMVMA